MGETATSKRTEHSPTLNTVSMVEHVIKNSGNSVITIAEIKRALPKQINHNTLKKILEYLEESNKIFVSIRGITWTHNTNPALKKAMDIDEIKKRSAPILRKFGVEKAAVFGSFARGEEKESSDIDMLVELPKGTSLLIFAGLKLELEFAFGRKIDLVSYGWIDEHIKDQIMRERVVLYE